MSNNQVLEALKSILGLDAAREVRAKYAAEIIRASGPYRWVGIYDVDHERGTVSNLAWSGPGPPTHAIFPMTIGLTARAINKKRTVNIGNVTLNPDYLATLDNTQSEIIVPVLDYAGEHVIGTIDVESEQRKAFNKEAQQLLERCVEVLRPLWMTGLLIHGRPRKRRQRS